MSTKCDKCSQAHRVSMIYQKLPNKEHKPEVGYSILFAIEVSSRLKSDSNSFKSLFLSSPLTRIAHAFCTSLIACCRRTEGVLPEIQD